MNSPHPRLWEDAASEVFALHVFGDEIRTNLPIAPEDLAILRGSHLPEPFEDFAPHAQVIALDPTDDDTWFDLHEMFSAAGGGPTAPWNRCLSLLREHGAVACVIEQHYVCLDYKSELLSFYSQLDRPRTLTTTRLHFFAKPVSPEQLASLDKAQVDSYLGYVVCRGGKLPLVGRANIKVPTYVTIPVGVAEKVHLFGQKLEVTGMPFMQQDAKFAVCAQVAVWAIHYAAFRMGLVQRRLVAEIVAMSGAIEPMKPRVSDGLYPDEAARLFRAAGLSATSYQPCSGSDDLISMPVESVPGAQELIDRLKPLLDDQIADSLSDSDDVARWASECFFELSENQQLNTAQGHLATELLDAVLFHILAPSIRSNQAVYASTSDHAMVICGLRASGGTKTFFVHDDQFGPYLALNSLAGASKTDLRAQAHNGLSYPRIKQENPQPLRAPADDVPAPPDLPAFPHDRTAALVEGGVPFTGFDTDRQVDTLVFGRPTRLVVMPQAAELECLNLLERAQVNANPPAAGPGDPGPHGESANPADRDGGPPSVPAADPDHEVVSAEEGIDAATGSPAPRGDVADGDFAWRPRTTALMGIDYKEARRAFWTEKQDPDAAMFVAASHLPEWVIVVEDGSSDTAGAAWEVVYDGTSGETKPASPFARFGSKMVAKHPLDRKPATWTALLDSVPFIEAPGRVGKL